MALPPKLLEYRANRISGLSRYKSAIKAGFSVNQALRASRLDKAISASLVEIMEKEGIDNKYISDKILSGLEAKRFVVDKNGTVHEFPDQFIQHKYLETYLKIVGALDPKGNDGDASNLPKMIINTLNITVENRKVVDVVR